MIRTFTFRDKPFQIYCSSEDPNHASAYTFVDENEVRERQWNVKEGDIVLDVGAAYGSYTLTALLQGAAFVYAWSPQADIEKESDCLHASLKLNGWEDKAIVYGTGIYSSKGFLNTVSQEMVATGIENPDVIQVDTLDNWADEVFPRRIDWVKLDVEGAEVEVLKSAEKLIRKFQPNIQVENHLFKKSTIAEEVNSLLQTFGYATAEHSFHHSVSHSLHRPLLKMVEETKARMVEPQDV